MTGKASSESPKFSKQARLRIAEVFFAFDTQHESPFAAVSRRNQADSLTVGATRIIQRQLGEELTIDRFNVKASVQTVSAAKLQLFIMGASAYLSELEGMGYLDPGRAQSFAQEINAIAHDDEFPYYLDSAKHGWMLRISSDAEALRRALLANPADVAECKRGDPQVETVVSTVQALLARPSPVIVDYGVGLGRVLSGFETAKRFEKALYIAVDEPIDPQVKALGRSVGARFQAVLRSKFLEQPTAADAIILLNTLHHIPFADLPYQLSILLTSLKEHGVLVVHEINELREPEQFNVPWEAEDIAQLFAIQGCEMNPRTMQTRSQRVPLTNMLVHIDGVPPSKEIIASKCAEIWTRMKTRTLQRIRDLYKRGDAQLQVQLQYALIANANLDLNRP